MGLFTYAVTETNNILIIYYVTIKFIILSTLFSLIKPSIIATFSSCNMGLLLNTIKGLAENNLQETPQEIKGKA